MAKWLQLLAAGKTIGSVSALVALGFVTIYRYPRIVDMAQGSVVMIGAQFARTFLRGSE
jgi:branched-chain amino acid transport system permease protein